MFRRPAVDQHSHRVVVRLEEPNTSHHPTKAFFKVSASVSADSVRENSATFLQAGCSLIVAARIIVSSGLVQ